MTVPFALPWLAFAIAWLVLGPVAVALHAVSRSVLARAPVAQRSTLLLALALLPVLGAATVAVLGFAPQIGGLAVNGHCHAGSGCGPHVPTFHAPLLGAAAVAALVVLASAALCWRFAERLRRSLALAGTLRSLAAADVRDARLATVESEVPFAYCVGLLSPRVVVSQGLLSRLTRGQSAAVLAHEQSHATRFDNLRQWLAALSVWFLPRRWCAPLLQDLASAAEQASDTAAAIAAGRANLAGALRALAVSESAAAARLARIRSDDEPWPATGVLALVVLVYTLCVLPLLDGTHYIIECLLAAVG